MLRGLADASPQNRIGPHRRLEVIGAEQLAESLGRLLEPPAVAPLVAQTRAPRAGIGRTRTTAARPLLAGQQVRRRAVSERPEQPDAIVLIEVPHGEHQLWECSGGWSRDCHPCAEPAAEAALRPERGTAGWTVRRSWRGVAPVRSVTPRCVQQPEFLNAQALARGHSNEPRRSAIEVTPDIATGLSTIELGQRGGRGHHAGACPNTTSVAMVDRPAPSRAEYLGNARESGVPRSIAD